VEQSNINMNYVVKEYQEKVANLTNENVVMNALIKQLKAELEQAKSEILELKNLTDKQ
jgi:peptidoglycan hydrolase CwlO-like protein